MNVNGVYYRSIWPKKGDNAVIQIIDQRKLPHEFVIEDLRSFYDVTRAIKEMYVRGAGLITEMGICKASEESILDLYPEPK